MLKTGMMMRTIQQRVTEIKLHYIQIGNSYFKLQFFLIYFFTFFDRINAALMHIRDFFSKTLKSYQPQNSKYFVYQVPVQ